MNSDLVNAYKFHRRNRSSRGRPAIMNATQALQYAREDVAAGKKRGLAYVEKPENAGLRFVGRVMAECGGRNGIWDNRESSGWYTNPHGDVFRDGSDLCYGVVYQLAGRDGKARFVAGYQFGGTDSGPTLDLSNIHEDDARSYEWQHSAFEFDGARDAAFVADSMARIAADEELEYQRAWQAGSAWADCENVIADSKATIRQLLAERRAAKAANVDMTSYGMICATIRRAVANALDDIAAEREKMKQLAEGDYSERDLYLGFYTGDETLRAAFNDGAGETVLV